MSKLDEEQLGFLTESLQSLEYGSILITIHDGMITQIDTTEKKRFSKGYQIPKDHNYKRK